MKTIRHCCLFLLCLFLLAACRKDHSPGEDTGSVSVSNDKVVLNPTGRSPLAATLSFQTSVPCRVSLQVDGKQGAAGNVVKNFDELSSSHTLPVLGLYAATTNQVELTFTDAAGTVLGHKSYSIQTYPLPGGLFPTITINTKNEAAMAPGMTLVNYFGYAGSDAVPQSPFIYDAFGDVRWYLSFAGGNTLGDLFYDDGIKRLRNGNLFFGNTNNSAIYEMDMLGNIINKWDMPGYSFHHDVIEKPNGNFLVTANKTGSATTEDYIIEIDRNTKQIVRTWNLMQSLQYSRHALDVQTVDWIHVNAVVYDSTDNTIIISGRTQALVKLDENNHVVWIMGCHKGWGTAGDGTDLTRYLLQPLDAAGQPITDTAVLNGSVNHPDFEWNWYQHNPMLMPNGHIMLFDNGGDNRNFSGFGQYSRAVEYEINAVNKTVQQVWEYGKERGTETFSHIVSGVEYFPQMHHVIFSPGAIAGSYAKGKVVEVNYDTKEVISEVTLTPAQAFAGITFHRTLRMSLYP